VGFSIVLFVPAASQQQRDTSGLEPEQEESLALLLGFDEGQLRIVLPLLYDESALVQPQLFAAKLVLTAPKNMLRNPIVKNIFFIVKS